MSLSASPAAPRRQRILAALVLAVAGHSLTLVATTADRDASASRGYERERVADRNRSASVPRGYERERVADRNRSASVPRGYERERVASLSDVPAAPPPTALTWRRTSFATTATAAQRLVQVMYPFKNTSAHPVRITTITTSCGCTAAGEHRDVYAPGENGVIPVTFTVGSRRGPQDKEILVFTDESARPYALALHVDIEPLYAVEAASSLSGAADGRVREYTFTITARTAAPILVTGVSSALPLQSRIEAVAAGRKYVVHLTPYPGDRKPLTPGARPAAVSLHIYVDGVGTVTEPATVFIR